MLQKELSASSSVPQPVERVMVCCVGREASKKRTSINDLYNTRMYVILKICFLERDKLAFYGCGAFSFDKVTDGTQDALCY
jgi:hypothetical protein